jgi:hypothetical protein
MVLAHHLKLAHALLDIVEPIVPIQFVSILAQLILKFALVMEHVVDQILVFVTVAIMDPSVKTLTATL